MVTEAVEHDVETGAGPRLLLARPALGSVVASLTIAALALASGGYNPPSWGWSALAMAGVATVAAVLRERIDWSWGQALALTGLTGTAALQLLSGTWSGSVTVAALEAERTLVYVAGLLAITALTWRGALRRLQWGLLAAVVVPAADGMFGRLFPDLQSSGFAVDSDRLTGPLGYWNALGILAASGILVALGLTAEAGRRGRMAAAAATPLLAVTLYLTFSRGAWISLAAGVLTTLLLHPRRGRYLAAVAIVAPPAGLAVLVAGLSPALTTSGQSTLADASFQGHRLAAALAACTIVAMLAAGRSEWLGLRFDAAPRAIARAAWTALVALPLIGVIGVTAWLGTPAQLVDDASSSFAGRAGERPGASVDRPLNPRLLSLSGSNRHRLWQVAWRGFEQRPVLGNGAGTYERAWLAQRPISLTVRDAHSLPLERLYELGLAGGALVLLIFVPPVAAGVRRRLAPAAAPATGTLIALLVHQSFDWDWEMPAVTLMAVALAAALMAEPWPALAASRHQNAGRVVLVGGAVLVAVAAAATLPGNLATEQSRRLLDGRNTQAALAAAVRATDRAPWSADAWRARGLAQLALGRSRPAAADFRRAVSDDGGDWESWYDLSRALPQDEKRVALERAMRLNPIEIRRLLRRG
jgi:O-Antigen ligase